MASGVCWRASAWMSSAAFGLPPGLPDRPGCHGRPTTFLCMTTLIPCCSEEALELAFWRLFCEGIFRRQYNAAASPEGVLRQDLQRWSGDYGSQALVPLVEAAPRNTPEPMLGAHASFALQYLTEVRSNPSLIAAMIIAA